MKKILPITALCVVAVITIITAACGSSPKDAPPTEAATASTTPQTITTAATYLETPPPFEIEHQDSPYSHERDTPPEPPYSEEDAVMLAKTVWGEARGCAQDEQRLVVWTVLQRVDAPDWANTIRGVTTQKAQFVGYDESHPIDPDIYALCAEELVKWYGGATAPTHKIYAPTAPYYFFDGDGSHNWFRKNYKRR